MQHREFHEDLKLNVSEIHVLKSLAAGLTLKEIAAASVNSLPLIKFRMYNLRKKNKFATTEEIMYWLGRSGQLESKVAAYEFPIGV